MWKTQKRPQAPAIGLLAREHRKNPTPEEALLWGKLRNKNLGVKFRRQHAIVEYILDFYCPQLKLAVEIDGRGHDPFHDHARDGHLKSYGILTLRFSNDQVRKQMPVVLRAIRETVEARRLQ